MRHITAHKFIIALIALLITISGYPLVSNASHPVRYPIGRNVADARHRPAITSVYNKTQGKNDVLGAGDTIEITGTRMYGIKKKTVVHFARKIDDSKPWTAENTNTVSVVATLIKPRVVIVSVPAVEGETEGSLRITNYRILGRVETSPLYPVHWATSPITQPSLTVTRASDNDAKAPSTQVIGGTSGVNTLYLAFTPRGENVELRLLRLTLKNASSTADSVAAVHLYSGDTKIIDGAFVI